MSVPCTLCGATSFYFCGPKYYCGQHRAEAIAETKRQNDRRIHDKIHEDFRGGGK